MLKTKQIHDATLMNNDGLWACDKAFMRWLLEEHTELYHALVLHRQKTPMNSEQLIAMAELFEQFVTELFGLEDVLTTKKASITRTDPVIWMKYNWWPKHVKPALKKTPQHSWEECLKQWTLCVGLTQDELTMATWLQANESCEWWRDTCVWLSNDADKRASVADWQLFHRPKRIDFDALFSHSKQGEEIKVNEQRDRDGFGLTDHGATTLKVQDEVQYCALCHQTQVDYCRTGFHQKKHQPEQGFRRNALQQSLQGCPLDEKISETHALRRRGGVISALAMIMMDNPLCPATGHRICNDCMQSCIYQKQTPVNIPEVESRVLMDVLSLPWGIELYYLLLRWNPLRPVQYLPQPVVDDHVLVMGQGPAGFTMAYHLLMAGVQVTGMDGLAIESLPQQWLTQPIKDWHELAEHLEKRPVRGFGGVAEYGITVRWNKNFLTLIYVCLARMKHYHVMGGIRFGGTLTLDDAKTMGFDHVALALGAGLPKELNIKGSLTPGMRQANDFLMALQLSGAVHRQASTDLQVRMPAIVIGGGLTGVDTATEVQAYYWKQIQQVSERAAAVIAVRGEGAFWQSFSASERVILEEMMAHWQAYTNDHTGRSKIDWIQEWGGVRIVYRKRMIDSPAYRTNPHELHEALKEGVLYVEQLSPHQTIQDAFGHVTACVFQRTEMTEGGWMTTEEEVRLSVKTLLVATGAKPNIAYHFEHPGSLQKHGSFYQLFHQENNQWNSFEPCSDSKKAKGIMSSEHEGSMGVSILGDLHPHYHGSVVKAMASAKNHYEDIVSLLPKRQLTHLKGSSIQEYFKVSVHCMVSLGGARRITLMAKGHVARYQLGHFYRLSIPGVSHGHLTLWPDEVNQDLGLLTFTIDPTSVQRYQVDAWSQGKVLHLMGPSGVRMNIPKQPTEVLLVADALHGLKAIAMAKAMKQAGHKTWLYLAGDLSIDQLPQEWSQVCDGLATEDKIIHPNTTYYHASITHESFFHDVLPQWSHQQGIELVVSLSRWPWLKRTSDFLQRAPQSLAPNVAIKAAVHGPMQCMLKGICAQCLQWQIDPQTGERKKAVYACSWQDQPIDLIDWQAFEDRFDQHGAIKRLNDQYHHFNVSIKSDQEGITS